MITVHMIFNAHIDPVWLWPWQEGVDVALATCRSACDLMDKHPDLTFSQGEAWVYQQIEKIDPALLSRIRRHVRSGRWEIVNGWWIQPDCNFTGGVGFERQIQLGKAYFLERFGLFPQVGYNVDSFGHAASLPGIMRAAGQRFYVMMRPQEFEKKLPARLFRWRGFEGGPEVVTFRIAGSYGTGDITVDHVRRSLTELPPGIEHTMCFVGLGDHGGGPTEHQIEWCRENASAIDGCRLIFSTPSRFFEAIAAKVRELPLVTGELQHHAIGCYTVHRPVKTAVRAGEHLLWQAEIVTKNDPRPERDTAKRLALAWERVCTHHFHDTLGGTCIPSAYRQVEAQLGEARAIADEIIHHGVRRIANALGDDPQQRVVLFNASDQPFEGYTSFEPWVDWRSQHPNLQLADEQGRPIPAQTIEAEPLITAGWRTRLLLRLSVPPAAMRVLRIGTDVPPAPDGRGKVSASAERILNERGVWADAIGEIGSQEGTALRPQLELLDDPTDTWSHGIDRYAEGPGVPADWDAATLVDKGPLMASFIRHGQIGDSTLLQETRVYADWPVVEMILRIHWRQKHKVLKLVLPFYAPAVERMDGIPGAYIARELDGAERPLRDWTLFRFGDGRRLGVVCPDVFALDARPERARLTLLRSPLMANHDPRKPDSLRGLVADQGVHEFRFGFFCERTVVPDELDRHALMLHRPLVRADLTRGMGATRPRPSKPRASRR